MQAFGPRSKSRNQNVPGWNDYVKDFYASSRQAFTSWRRAGSPREGPIAQHMRRARAHFKMAMRHCKQNEQNIRAEKIYRSYKEKNIIDFWKLIKKVDNFKLKLPKRIDQANTEKDICSLWREKYSDLLNSVSDDGSFAALQEELYDTVDTRSRG